MTRKPYPTDVSDEEWAFVAPCLTSTTEAAPQRDHSLREVFNGVRWIVRTGRAWRLMPHDLRPWYTVYQQTQRWLKAGVFEAMVQDLREILRILAGRNEQPSAVILDSRTLQSTVESGHRAGYDGGKRKQGSQGSHGSRYVRTLACSTCHACQRASRAQVAELVQQVQ